jgi:hypothetical protein
MSDSNNEYTTRAGHKVKEITIATKGVELPPKGFITRVQYINGKRIESIVSIDEFDKITNQHNNSIHPSNK